MGREFCARDAAGDGGGAVRTTPDALERRAAQQEAAALREQAQAQRLKRARAMLDDGMPLKQVARHLGMSPVVLRRERAK